MPDSTESPATPGPSPAAEFLVRATGLLVAGVLALLSGLLEALYTSAYVGGVRAPWSLIAAVAGNLALVWFARYTVGTKWAPIVPALVWILVMLVATYRTHEGDLLITGDNPMGFATMLAGVAAFAVGWWVPEVRRTRRLHS